MCRIAGILDKNSSKDELTEQVKAMADIQQHGGPDDEGFFIDENLGIALGHRRLSLVDLSMAGHQPMFDNTKNYGIIFNGEIYNYKLIKTELQQKGFDFKSKTDTEVVLYSYITWGVKSFQKLKGMFAFVIFDLKKQELFLVRDQQGIKPLYYYHQNDRLAFASEVKAFKVLSNPLKINTTWPIAFLSMGHLPEPFTTYKNVFMLPKGHYLKYNIQTEKLEGATAFYTVNSDIRKDDNLLGIQEKIDTLLDNAIQQQLIADATIGVFLSGGIDSSLLALQAAKYQREKLITVSIDFEEASFSEKKYQEKVSAQLPGKHVSKKITKEQFNFYFDEILENMDQPGVDGINSWFVSKAAKEAGLTAVISGVGADELFGGYPSFQRIRAIPYLKKVIPAIQFLNKFLKKDTLDRISYLSLKHPIFEYLFLRGFFSPNQLQKHFGITQSQQVTVLNRVQLPTIPLPDKFDGKRAAWMEQHFFMQNQLLKDTDTMSMQHGLEIRVPFLDDDLVNYINQLPSSVLYPFKQPAKHLLINAFKKILPELVYNRPKMGFSFPFQQWLKQHPRYLRLKNLYPDLKEIYFAFENNKLHWSKIMSLLVMEKFDGFEVLRNRV